MKASKKKYPVLKTLLAESILSGRFTFNQEFPGIKQIAEEYHVCYLTAAKAMKLLTEEGYLRCQNGVGHFVNYVPCDTPVFYKKVNIITSHLEYTLRKHFFQKAVALFRSKGWDARLLKCSPSGFSSLIPEINSPDSYSILCELQVPWRRFLASFASVSKRVLLLGTLAGNSQITSIISSEYKTVQLAMQYFAEKGRKRIAILSSHPEHELESLRIGAWRDAVFESGLNHEWAARHCFSFSQGGAAYDLQDELPRLCRWLQTIRKDTDGLIIPVHHASAVSACLECGIRIPEELSILHIALTDPVLPDGEKYLRPGGIPDMDVLDHNYFGHFECALGILEERFRSGINAEGSWYFCPPGTIQKCRKE